MPDFVARYPRRSPHPPRPRVKFDTVGRASSTRSSLLLALGAPLALREASTASPPARPAEDRAANANPDLGGRSSVATSGGNGRAVRFNSVVKLILVPARADLDGLSADLWWQEEDYLHFRLGAIVEGSADALRRTLRRRARPVKSTPNAPIYVQPSEIVQALQVVDPTADTRPTQRFRKRSASSSSARAQPLTPPSSPTNAGRASTREEARSFSDPLSNEWAYVEDYDGFVGLRGLPA